MEHKKREEAVKNSESIYSLCLVPALHVSLEVLFHWVITGPVPSHFLAKRIRKYQIVYFFCNHRGHQIFPRTAKTGQGSVLLLLK